VSRQEIAHAVKRVKGTLAVLIHKLMRCELAEDRFLTGTPVIEQITKNRTLPTG
jgi:hypothetical protein